MPQVSDRGLDNLLSPSVCQSLTHLVYVGLPKVTEEGYLALNRASKLKILRLFQLLFCQFQPLFKRRLFEVLPVKINVLSQVNTESLRFNAPITGGNLLDCA